MKKVFILQNQNKLFLNRQNEWVEGSEASSLFKTPYKDEAINQMFEVSSKDYTQRVQVLNCTLNEKNIPLIPDEAKPSLAVSNDESDKLSDSNNIDSDDIESLTGTVELEFDETAEEAANDEPIASTSTPAALTFASSSLGRSRRAQLAERNARSSKQGKQGKLQQRALKMSALKKRY